MPTIERNTGFQGRMFLSRDEWETYCRRKPVRFVHKKKEAACQVCGEPGSPDRPLQNAHVIGFDIGVIDLALTPDYLDSDTNIVTAHRSHCNKKAELNLHASIARLRSLGATDPPDFICELWRSAP